MAIMKWKILKKYTNNKAYIGTQEQELPLCCYCQLPLLLQKQALRKMVFELLDLKLKLNDSCHNISQFLSHLI